MKYEFAVEAIDVAKYYYLGGGKIVIKALDGVTVRIKHGEYLSLMGPSGSGKTTFFNVIGGLDRPTKGKVFIDRLDIAQLDAYELARLRCRRIGYIFQTFNLIPVLTALENVELPMIFANVPREERIKRATKMLERVGLGDRLYHKPTELSGGQQQRVAIARALVNNPTIVLADEPTANLDLHTGLEIIKLLRELNRERAVTVLCATHDLKMIDVSDRIIWIRDGKLSRIEERSEVMVEIEE